MIKEKKEYIKWNEEEQCFNLQLFSDMLGNRIIARIGKEKAIPFRVEYKHGCLEEELLEQWEIQYRHPDKEELTFTAIVKVYDDHMVFDSIQHFSKKGKQKKSPYGNPYISFPEFEGDHFAKDCACLTFKRQVPFNYPVRWIGSVTDSLREGKNSPLIATDRGYRTIVLSPLNHLLHATVSITKNPKSIRCGVPRAVEWLEKGSQVKTILVFGQGTSKTMLRWGELLRQFYGTKKVAADADCALQYISYWTNAGSAYWYKGHKKDSYEETFQKLLLQHKKQGLTFGSYQLDSWWYQKDGNQYTSSIVNWEPKKETLGRNFNSLFSKAERERKTMLFSEDRLSYVQKILGKPLGAHFKQLSKDSVYVKGSEEEFYLEPFAIPKNKEFAYGLFRQIFHHPHWNLSYVVHDWFSYMNDHHQAFRKIETAEGYFEGLDQALLDTPAACNQCGHLSLQLCMSQPHITMMSVGMQSVSHIRSTSDSKSFFVEGKKRWRWHLYSSLLIHSLGKYPFYDQRNTDPFNLTTNRHIEFELIWIALSGGPMGFGDRIGRENKELIYRFVRPNGEILRPDQVALPLDRCFWTNFEKRKMNEAATVVASSAIHNLHGRASYKLYYLLDMNISKTLKRAKTFYHFAEILEEDEIRKKQNYVLFDRRSEEIQVIQEDQALKSISGFRIYQYRCVAPIQKGFAFFGDCNKAVSASSQLFSQIHFEENTLRFTILRREKELSSRIVLYSKSSPNQVTIDGEAIPFIYQKEKVEFDINVGFVGQVTVCVTRK